MAKDPVFKEENFISDPCGATRESGVYAICIFPLLQQSFPSVVYIGSSKNIYQRINNRRHIYRRLFNFLVNYFACCYYLECDNYEQEEKRLVRKYRPRFNYKLY